MQLECLKIQNLPVISPCYCSQCKTPMTTGRVVDKSHAWCPNCNQVVDTCAFQVHGWTIGTTVVLALILLF